MKLIKGEAISYFESLTPESEVPLSNEAEWLTDVIVKADRDDRVDEFAEKYDGSALKQRADEDINSSHSILETAHDEIVKELAVKKETSTHFYYALYVLLKV